MMMIRMRQRLRRAAASWFRVICLVAMVAYLPSSKSQTATKPNPRDRIIALTMVEGDLNHGVNVALEIIKFDHKTRAFILLTNKSQKELWIPIDGPESYKPDTQTNTLFLWFGYFDEVQGHSPIVQAHYMVPYMQYVPPGWKSKIEITFPDQLLLKILARQRLKLDLKIRVATKPIARNLWGPSEPGFSQQPREEYIKNSFVIHAKQL